MYHGSPWMPGAPQMSRAAHPQVNSLIPASVTSSPVVPLVAPNSTSFHISTQQQSPQIIHQLHTVPVGVPCGTPTPLPPLNQHPVLHTKHNAIAPFQAVHTPRVAALQQQFAHNFLFTNSDNYHCHKKPPTPPRKPVIPETRLSTQSNYSNICHKDKEEEADTVELKSCEVEQREKDSDSENRDPNTLMRGQQKTKRNMFIQDTSGGPRGQKRRSDGSPYSSTESSPHSSKRWCVDTEKPGSLLQRLTNLPQTGGVSLSDDQLEEISNVIWQGYERSKQSKETYERKMKLREALYTVLKGVFPYCGLYVVGSSMNGLGSNRSDMDLCLMLSLVELDQKNEATEILRLLQKSFARCGFLKRLQLIRAKVPILKFTDDVSGLECDLNINNWVGIRNTHLLNAYSQVDHRVCPLVQFVKHWANYHNINDASKGTISSYSLVLMVLHYLQCGCKPAVVPCLQEKFPQKFTKDIDIRELTLNEDLPQFVSPNKDSVGKLFTGFLQYYAKFNYQRDGISIRLGRIVDIQSLKGQAVNLQWKFICIEEPFDFSNTARAVYDENNFQHIVRVFRQSYAAISRSGNVDSLFSSAL